MCKRVNALAFYKTLKGKFIFRRESRLLARLGIWRVDTLKGKILGSTPRTDFVSGVNTLAFCCWSNLPALMTQSGRQIVLKRFDSGYKPEPARVGFFAGSILQIEPKRFDSGYKPEPACCHGKK